MIILGIETSCDETAVAIVSADKTIHAHLVLSQLEEHTAFGGVVPEIAARAHIDHLDALIRAALLEAKMDFRDLSGIAATCGPGLIGGVLVGMMTGKAIAAARGLPFMAINHLEGHALTPRLTAEIDFPYLLLLVSGGHTQILVAEGVGRYRLWGQTLDDAAGECFDKCAKLMGLPYPGGPHVEKQAALSTNKHRFALPRPMKGRRELDFSFSGLKTAVRLQVEKLGTPLAAVDRADLCFALQEAIADVLADRCARALERFIEEYRTTAPTLIVSGGVAANIAVRQALEGVAKAHGASFHAPPLSLCSDNAAMIAWAGIERLQRGLTDGMNFKARPRWPLEELEG
jgi:N6-L-threonylcarbamoyladenine synthase